jgi:hypothetical protein
MTAVEQLIAEIEQELQEREGCNGALNSGAVLGLTNAKNIAYKYLEMEKEGRIEFAKMHVKIALKAVENEMILQASSVKHWYLPQNIK